MSYNALTGGMDDPFKGIPLSGYEAKEAKNIFEAAASENAQLDDFATQQLRAAAMSLALTFVSEGSFTFDDLLGGATMMADMDENEELDEEENAYMNDLLQATADAFISMGADAANVTAFMDDEEDEAGATMGAYLTEKMADVTKSDEELIASYATGGDVVLESMIKRIVGGKVMLKKKRVGIAKKMSSLQKAAMKKARSKAFTSAAKMKRKKSMKIRRKMGL